MPCAHLIHAVPKPHRLNVTREDESIIFPIDGGVRVHGRVQGVWESVGEDTRKIAVLHARCYVIDLCINSSA